MEVFNKLYSQVHSTVSQLSSVLPGNPVTREFDATCHIASAGPGKSMTGNLLEYLSKTIIRSAMEDLSRF